METFRQGLLFRDVRVASADRSHDFAGKFGAAIAERRVPFPAMIEMSRQKTVEVVGEEFFKLLAGHCCFRYGLLQDTRLELSRGFGHCTYATCRHSAFHC